MNLSPHPRVNLGPAAAAEPLPEKVKLVSIKELPELEAILEQKLEAIAVDCEGVDLGRFGTLNVLTLATKDQIYLLDLFDIPRVPKEIKDVIKKILESDLVLKVMHGCQQDSDALMAHLNTRLQNVYDTQMADLCVRRHIDRTDTRYRSLNDTLTAFECPINPHKVNVDYRTNPDYWAKRPLTQEMLDYASNDVQSLLTLRERQQEALVQLNIATETVMMQSLARVTEIRDAKFVELVKVPEKYRGRVIGSQGCNLKAMERQHGCSICVRRKGFIVRTDSLSGLNGVKNQISRTINHSSHLSSYYDDDDD